MTPWPRWPPPAPTGSRCGLVGQQDRRHLLAEPFLAGRLDGLACRYPLEVFQPPRAQDVPGCLAQAWHAAALGQGPVNRDRAHGGLGRARRRRARASAADQPAGRRSCSVRRDRHRRTARPFHLTSPGHRPRRGERPGLDRAQRPRGQAGLPRLPGDLPDRPARLPAGPPAVRRLLSARRAALRAALAPHDAVLVAGAALLRQYHYEPGPLVEPGTRVAVISADPGEVQRSPADIGLVAPVASAIAALAQAIPGRAALNASTSRATPCCSQRARAQRRALAGLTPEAVFAALAAVLPADAIVVEECPSSREALQLMLPARQPLGYLGLAMGGLGFGLPAAIGMRMAMPGLPFVGIIGDGSAAYCYQALWDGGPLERRSPVRDPRKWPLPGDG